MLRETRTARLLLRAFRDSDADAVGLQEVSREHCAVLRRALQTAYPFVVGETELARHKGHEF